MHSPFVRSRCRHRPGHSECKVPGSGIVGKWEIPLEGSMTPSTESEMSYQTPPLYTALPCEYSNSVNQYLKT